MTIEITQNDILMNNGTKEYFEKNNFKLDENTDIIMNGKFDNGVLDNFYDYLKVKSYFINSITAPECENLPPLFFVRIRMVKKIIIREGTKNILKQALGGCDIETLVLPQSFELITKDTFEKSAIRNIEFSGSNKTENAKWTVKEDGLYYKDQNVLMCRLVKYPVSKMPYLSHSAISYATDKPQHFFQDDREDEWMWNQRQEILNTWKKPVEELKSKIISKYEKNIETLTFELLSDLCAASPYSKNCIDWSHKMIERIVPGFYRKNSENILKVRQAYDNNIELPKSIKDYFLYHRPYADPRNFFMVAIFSKGVEIFNVYYSVYVFLEKSEVKAFPELMFEVTNLLPYTPVIVPIHDADSNKIGEQEFHGDKI